MRGGSDKRASQRGQFQSHYRGRGRGQSSRPAYHKLDEIDDIFLMAENNLHNHETSSPGSRARGRGLASMGGNNGSETSRSNRGAMPPRGRGRGDFSNDYQLSRGSGGGSGDLSSRGRGKGRRGSKLPLDAPLSRLLSETRPLLRPVFFVPSINKTRLFEEEEEIFQPVIEEFGEDGKNHVPTADRVFRVFSGGNVPRPVSSGPDHSDDGDLEEVDFKDMAKILEIPNYQASKRAVEPDLVEEKFSGIYISRTPVPIEPESYIAKIANEPTPSLATPPVSPFLTAGPSLENVELTSLAPTEILSQTGLISVESRLPDTKISLSSPRQVTDIPTTSLATSSQVELTPTSLEGPTAFQIPFKSSHVSAPSEPGPSTIQLRTDEHPIFYFDTKPSSISPSVSTVPTPKPILPATDDGSDEEVIIYVAPHPRSESGSASGREIPVPPASVPSLPLISILTGTTITAPSVPVSAVPSSQLMDQSFVPPPEPPAFSSVSFTSFSSGPVSSSWKAGNLPHLVSGSGSTLGKKLALKKAKKKKRMEKERIFAFGRVGALVAEARLRGSGSEDDLRREERRRGDEDVNWGDADVDSEGVGGVAEGMEVDPEVGMDMEVMTSFVRGLVGPDSGRFTTMDDVEDQEMIRKEDQEGDGDGRGSSGEDGEGEEGDGDEASESAEEDEDGSKIAVEEEELLFAEGAVFDGLESSDDDDDDASDDEGDSPRVGFKARLERVRNQVMRQGVKDEVDKASIDEEDETHLGNLPSTKADEKEDTITLIQDILDENEDILTSSNRKARNRLFRAIQNGAFDDMDEFRPARKKKDKYKDLSTSLKAQWKKDRAKKAEHKKARALARLELAADPLLRKKGGKKGRKAMLALARTDPTITVLPNRVVDMESLVQQIRRFLADLEGSRSMALPPMEKEHRKKIHEMAVAFGLKSVSKGKGEGRYITLLKTTKSGVGVDEEKVGKIMRKARGGGGGGGYEGENWGKKNGKGVLPRQREGEEVGKTAPKIGEDNIGFKLLSLMGWSEGGGIGVSGGLEVPVTAVIKHSKLGLGATK